MADLQLFDIEKYKYVLSNQSMRDFRMALGLYSSGVGCGSFLYLRRIFETIVEEAHKECLLKEDWNEEKYIHLHFDEKMTMIESNNVEIVPDIMRDIKNSLYGILSKGVHESSDQDCMKYFPALKILIEYILDNKLDKREKEKKLKEAKKIIQDMR